MIKFDISNRNLTSLVSVNFPENVQKLYCDHNLLTNFDGCPPSVQILYCNNNQITSLEGCPPSVQKLYCWNNQLKSLEGCPPSVQILYCYNNQLTTLEGCPSSLQVLVCDHNQLTSLEDCPPSVQKLWRINNPLNTEYRNKSIEQIHKINRIKAYRKGILKLNSIIFPTLIQRCFRYHYYDKLNSNGVSLFCLRSMEEDRKSGIII